MIYFTSDQHFYHDNIIKHANRPFKSFLEMNKTLIKKWNDRVSFNDEVYILGDITMKGSQYAQEILSQLKGKKYLIKGNHDSFLDSDAFDISVFEWIKDYAELEYKNTKFILFHYPIAEWNGFYHNTIDLHGHQHNNEKYNFDNLKKGILRYDVGVDANYMAPVSAEEIMEFLHFC